MRAASAWWSKVAAGALFLILWAVRASGEDKVRTLLFVDDHEVLYRSGTRRVQEPLKRYPLNPLIRGRSKPWEVALAWTSVYRNPSNGLYQLWYQAFAGDAAHDRTRRCIVCYAESQDGVHFVKPNLGLFDFNGDTNTSIVLVAHGGKSDRYGVSVVVDAGATDVSRRYKMAYFDFGQRDGREYPGLHVAFSPDGIHWKEGAPGPLSVASYGRHDEPVPLAGEEERPWSVPLSMSDALDVFYDAPRACYAIYGKMWIDGPGGGMYWKHAMGRIESRDFVHWSKPALLLTPDDQDAAWVEFHTTPVFYYENCYFCPLQILNRAESGGVIDIELATSRDGLQWERNFRKPFWLARATGSKFDGGSIFLCPQAVVLEDEIRFYYGGYSAGATGSDDSQLTTGIGLATMRKNRFGGIQPVPLSDQPTLRAPLHDIGQVTLKPVTIQKLRSLEMNVDASAGAVWLEVLNEDGKRVPGFTKEEANPIRGDSLATPVSWERKQVSDLAPGKYLFRVHLEKATLYALTLREGEE